MFVLTLSRKRALRAALVILAIFIGIAVGIAAVLTSINTGASEARLPIYSVDRPDNKIALTFDCAWGNSNTDELLAILAQHNVFATFFVTGDFVDRFPDDVRRIANAGHEIANHSDMHPRIKGMNIHRLIEDTREAERKISMITGVKPTLYRSPYGEYDDNAVKTIEGLGYKFVQWSVDSIDWQEPDPATIVKRVTDKTVSGSILLFHNDLDNTTQALPEVLTRLRQAGFEFVRTGDLIYQDNYRIDHTGKQIRDVRTLLPVYGDDDAQIVALSQAVSILQAHLTLDEIASLRDGITPQIAARITPLLSSEQLSALSALSESETEAIMVALMSEEVPYVPIEPISDNIPDFTQPKDGEHYDGAEHGGESAGQLTDEIPNLTELLERESGGDNWFAGLAGAGNDKE
jgi:polysaccharide deacetylase family sporulation protein PdaB